LNILGCLDRPSSGKFILAGRDVAALEDDELSELRNEAIGFVFQSFNLIPQLTVLENIEVPILYRRHAASGDRERAIAAGCDDYDTKPVELPRLLEKIGGLLGAAGNG